VWVRSLFLCLLLSLNGTAPLSAQGDMQIRGEPPHPAVAMIMGNRWDIFLEGRIDSAAGERLKEYLETKRVPRRSNLSIHSPGGSVFGGMELGRVIREYELSVYVSRFTKDGGSEYRPFSHLPGECYSACTLAFVGGRFRFLNEKSTFGVHQFAFRNSAEADVGVAQVTSAMIVAYLRSMDIDVDFFRMSTVAKPSDMFTPPIETLKKLNVVNGGVERPKWTIESSGDGLYLKAERDSIYGHQKILLYCRPKSPIFFHMIYEAQGREDELMSMVAHTLIIGDRTYRQTPVHKEIHNGYFNAIYALSRPQAEILRSAQKIGAMVQGSYEAPMFLGIDDMPVTEPKRMLGLLNSCGTQ
jgi:hypothetical protein